MEFLLENYLNTTGSIDVDSNTNATAFLFNPDPVFQYVTENFNDDNTTASITINFDETLTVSRIAMISHNLKAFDIFYNGATANTFSMTSTGDTIASTWSSNSATAQYWHINPTACTSVTIDMKSTIEADAEKAIGYLVISDTTLDFPRIPRSKDYKPMRVPQEITHKMSDGRMRRQNIGDHWEFSVKFDHITRAFRDNLRSIYDLKRAVIFVPFGTATSWDEIIAPVLWIGPFEFHKHTDDAADAGFSGRMQLKESIVL